MTTPLRPFRDLEVGLMDWLEATFPALPGRVATVTPPTLQTLLATGPFVRCAKVTGQDDFVTDYSVVDIDVFARGRQDSYALAEEIRARLLGYPLLVGNVFIDRVDTETAPFHAPWEDENVHRRLATYRISTRR